MFRKTVQKWDFCISLVLLLRKLFFLKMLFSAAAQDPVIKNLDFDVISIRWV